MRVRLMFAGLCAGVLLFAGSVFAQIEALTLRVDGLACPFCAWGLEKKVMQMEGVTSYDADLKTGEVYVGLKEDARIELERFRQAVKEAGFTLRRISLRAAGTIERSEGGYALVVGGSHERLLLFETEAMAQEYHRGSVPRALGDQLEKELAGLAARGSAVRMEGPVHEHEGLPAGLSVERLEVLKSP